MADPAEIAVALLARCETLSVGSPALPVQMPDVTSSAIPPADGKYLAVSYFTNRPAWEGLSEGRMDQGLLQVSVVWPRQQGLVKPSQAASEVMGHFPKGLNLSSGSTKVTIDREPFAASPILEADKTTIPVTISWKAVDRS